MELLYILLSIALVIDAILLIVIILMQKTKGAEIGAVFGSGAAAAVLGAGAANIVASTGATVGDIVLTVLHNQIVKSKTVIQSIPEQPVIEKKQEESGTKQPEKEVKQKNE